MQNIIKTYMIHTTFGPILINFAPLEVVTKVEVKQMIGLAMDNFAEKQTTEDEEFRRIMQQAIATQFSSLGESLILNLQQAEMHLFNIVATTPMLLPLVQPQPPIQGQSKGFSKNGFKNTCKPEVARKNTCCNQV
ncbi:hypothetical protein HKD37_01G001367 [Glycine soja]